METKKPLIAFQGKFYTSLAQAAEDIGLAPSAAYRLKKKRGFSDEEVLCYYAERRGGEESVKRDSGRKKAVTINGILYASYTEALHAYQIPRVTVTSRMRRKKVDFETALTSLLAQKDTTLDTRIYFDPAQVSPLDEQQLSILQKNFYQDLRNAFCDIHVIAQGIYSGFQISIPLMGSHIIDCFILFSGKDIQFIVPTLPCQIQDREPLIRFIHTFNRCVKNCRVGYEHGSVMASWVIDRPALYHKFMIRMLAEFLNGCGQFALGRVTPIHITIPDARDTLPPIALDQEQRKTYETLKEELQEVSILKTGDSIAFSSPVSFDHRQPIPCYILYQIRSHTMIIPSLIPYTKMDPDIEELALAFNRQYMGCKLWADEFGISASWNVDGATKGFFEHTGQDSIRRFLASVKAFLERIFDSE